MAIEVREVTLAKLLSIDGSSGNPERKEEDDDEEASESQRLSDSRFSFLGLHTHTIPGKCKKESQLGSGNEHTTLN